MTPGAILAPGIFNVGYSVRDIYDMMMPGAKEKHEKEAGV